MPKCSAVNASRETASAGKSQTATINRHIGVHACLRALSSLSDLKLGEALHGDSLVDEQIEGKIATIVEVLYDFERLIAPTWCGTALTCDL